MTPSFEASELNLRKRRTDGLVRLLCGLMTALLILPVILILGVLVYRGGSVVSLQFLLTEPPR